MSADFTGCFKLKLKSRKTFDNTVSTRSVFFLISLWGGGCSPAVPPPPRVRQCGPSLPVTL